MGSFETIEENDNWKVKKLEPELKYRYSFITIDQNIVVVKGIATVEIDGKYSEVKKNESIYVPKQCKHRLSNLNKESQLSSKPEW